MTKADLISKPQPDGQEKIAEDISQSSRMTMCFRMPIMAAKANSNLTNAMSNNISIKE